MPSRRRRARGLPGRRARVLGLATAAGVPLWLDGGTGVDALLGRQTRDHGGPVLALEERHREPMLEALRHNGFGLQVPEQYR